MPRIKDPRYWRPKVESNNHTPVDMYEEEKTANLLLAQICMGTQESDCAFNIILKQRSQFLLDRTVKGYQNNCSWKRKMPFRLTTPKDESMSCLCK